MGLKFLHLHLHGLIRSKNLELGRDSDTGGQTKYVLELVKSLANTNEVDQVDLVSRLIIDKKVDPGLSDTFSFDQIGYAHQRMHENKHKGNMACLVNATKVGSGVG